MSSPYSTPAISLLLCTALSACGAPARGPAAPPPAAPGEPSLIRIRTVMEEGGRVDWSRTNVIAFDRLGADGYFDVFVMNPDATGQRCLTCNRPELPNRHMGNPAWHPSGRFLAFQAQKAEAPRNPVADYFANPGSGVNNDLWIMDVDASRFWQITDVELQHGAILHPHFSPAGDRLLWSERLSLLGGPIGEWALKVADVAIVDGTPRIGTVRQYQPGQQRRFYESHGFTPDGRRILFSGNLEPGQDETAGDIYMLDLDTGTLTNLTNDAREWDEHAQISPSGQWIVWMSSREQGPFARGSRTDYWMMRPDGSAKRRLTYLNEPGRPEHIPGGVVAADSAWSPDGSRLLAYVIREVSTGAASLLMLEFSPAAVEDPDPSGPPDPEDAGRNDEDLFDGPRPREIQLMATERDTRRLRELDAAVETMIGRQQLQLLSRTRDPLVRGRTHERFVQMHDGVQVAGSQVVRQRAGARPVSIFGVVYADLRVDATPHVEEASARNHLEETVPGLVAASPLRLVIATGIDGAGAALAYEGRVLATDNILLCYVDARAARWSTCRSNIPHRPDRADDGDPDLPSVRSSAAPGQAVPRSGIAIYDMRGDARRTLDVLATSSRPPWLESFGPVTAGDHPVAPILDRHAARTLEILQQRLGQDPFTGREPPILLVHAADGRRSPGVPLLAGGPFYAGRGILVVPDAEDRRTGRPVAPSLATVAHEIGHAIIERTAGLPYDRESDAVNEAFASLVESAVVGTGRSGLQPGRVPHETGSASTAVVHAFVAAGRAPLRPGSDRLPRPDVERIYLRALTLMLPSEATVSMVRAATLQAAADLFGRSALQLHLVAAGWTAAGVHGEPGDVVTR